MEIYPADYQLNNDYYSATNYKLHAQYKNYNVQLHAN